MKCLERMLFKLAAIVIIACCGCKTTHSATSETHLSEATETHSEGGTVVTTTTTQGPETITTTVEEFAAVQPQPIPVPAASSAVIVGEHPAEQGTPGGPFVTRLVRRTVTVDQKGPSLSESHLEGHTASETHAETKVEGKATSESKSAPAASCAFSGMLWALALIGLSLALFAAVRKRMF